MKDVAKACGVSIMTVSRALKGDRRHAPETRAQICQMASAMGYRPNPLVSALMSQRGRHKPGKGTVNLGLLNPGNVDWIAHPFYQGAIRQATKLGFSIEAFGLSADRRSESRLRQILQNRGVKGLVVLPAPESNWRLQFDFRGFAGATIGYSIIEPCLPRVVTDSYSRLSEALDRAAERGYRRVGIVSTPDLNRRFKHQYLAAMEVHAQISRPRVRTFRLDVDSDQWPTHERRKLTKWIQHHRLEAIFTQLTGTEKILEESGFCIPQDLAFVYLHYHRDPRITFMDQLQEWMGRKATDVVVGMINRNEFDIPTYSQTIMIPSVWHEGETLPPK